MALTPRKEEVAAVVEVLESGEFEDSKRTCSFDGCSKPHLAKGWCSGHYLQARQGRTLTPLATHVSRSGPCLVDGCDRPRKGAGLCQGHRTQAIRGEELRELRRSSPMGSAAIRDDHGRKFCPSCGKWLTVSSFHLANAAVDGLRNDCKTCQRDVMLRNRYGIQGEDVAAMLTAQGGVCAICHRVVAKWNVDHDHSCCPVTRGSTAKTCGGCIRGVLCESCNKGLGYFMDSPERLAAAIDYLNEWSGR